MPDNNDPFLTIIDTTSNGNCDDDNNSSHVEYPTAYTSNVQINNILESMNVYDRNHITTQIMREKLANKLMDAALNIDLNDTDAESRDVNLHMITEARNILNDLDKAAKDNVAIKLKKKDTENAEASNINMAEFLSKIKLTADAINSGTVVQTAEEITANISKFEKEAGVIILDSETEDTPSMLPEKEEPQE